MVNIQDRHNKTEIEAEADTLRYPRLAFPFIYCCCVLMSFFIRFFSLILITLADFRMTITTEN